MRRITSHLSITLLISLICIPINHYTVSAKPVYDVEEQQGFYDDSIPIHCQNGRNTANSNGRSSRDAITCDAHLWPRGVVPFVIDPSLRNERKYILQAMNNYHQNSCVRFVRYTGQEDFINITYDAKRGCSSRVGRIGGEQTVSLSGEYCLYTGTIIHELGHVLGYEHEHQRPDRDQFVDINYEGKSKGRIQEESHNFEVKSKDQVKTTTGYDYNSIMHYGPHWFRAKKAGVKLVDPKLKYGLGQEDIKSVNALYKCKGRNRQNK